MGKYIGGISDALRKSINLKLWLYFLVITVIAVIAAYIAQTAIVDIPLGFFLAPYQGNYAKILADLATVFAISAFFSIINFIASELISAYFDSIALKVAKDAMQAKEVSIESAFKTPKDRIFTLFLAYLAIGFVSAAIFIILLLPSLGNLYQLVQNLMSSDPYALLGFIGNLIIALAVLMLLLIILSPALWLVAPVAILEKENVIGTFRKAFKVGFGTYFQNLAYILMFYSIIFVVALVWLVITYILSWINLILLLIPLILLVPIVLWLMAFSNLAK